MNNTNYWETKKRVLPQHSDHAGIMWHGAYLNWLEESRINALKESGISYIDLVNKGFEMPVIDIKIKYKFPIYLGDEISIKSSFTITKSPKININTIFVYGPDKLMTYADINVVLIRKETFSIIRHRPIFLEKIFQKLAEGPIDKK